MKKFAAVFLLASLLTDAALAQSGTVANHAVPIGKGPGVTGFGSAQPSTIGGLLMSNGASADPTFQSVLNLPLKGHLLGNASGTSATGAVTPADANILFYNGGSGSWAGVGTDSSGAVWFRAGLSGTPAPGMYMDNSGLVHFTQAGTFATLAQYLAGTPSLIPIAPATIYSAEVPVTFGTTTTFDFSTFINASVTLTGNITTQTLANVIAGKAGMITFIQDATGSRTTVWNTIFKFSGGPPALSTAPSAVDVLSYSCRSATFCVASLQSSVHNP